MQALLTSLKNPVWANAEHTRVDCIITTSQFGDEELPFTADQNDVESHGRLLFERIAAGEFGPISDYVPHPDPLLGPTPPSGEIPVTET
jgi:hypothetical protein